MDTNLNKENEEQESSLGNQQEIEDQHLSEPSNIDRAKEGNKSSFSSLATIVMLLILAVLSVASYAPIKDHFYSNQDHTIGYIESRDFAHLLYSLTNYLSQSKVQGESWNDPRYENLESIKYHITNGDETININNMSDITDAVLQRELEEKNKFYLHVIFDEQGNPKIENPLEVRFHKEVYINNFTSRTDKGEYANLDIIYIVPDDFENYNDFFAYNMKRSYVDPGYLILILIIGAVSISMLMIIAFSIPYSQQNKMMLSRLYNKMFLEFKLLFLLGVFIPFMFGITVMNTSYYNSFNLAETIYHANASFYALGIPITFLLFLLIYLNIVYIKYIYYSGFKKGFIENSILGKVCLSIVRPVKNLAREILLIDIREDNHKRILMILGINFLALWTIALTGFLGFILAILYTIFLFKYLMKLIKNAKLLSDASAQLAQGDFEIAIDENMGILNPLSDNLNNIKSGFQLAVEKATKSQRMKTELISNVSHDLKTPLTSIITYIDLLKSDDLNGEDAKKYISILDKKSKRLKSLIEDLFEASKANSGNIELQLEKVDVIALFRQTLGELEERITDSALQLKLNISEDKVICELDGKRTYRIFENIMSNILKYSLPNSRVYIDVVENKQEVSFIFRNISAYEMDFKADEITERFTRGDQARTTEGSGLGLSIAKNFVELQKGRLDISIDGDLFKLTVTFPKVNR